MMIDVLLKHPILTNVTSLSLPVYRLLELLSSVLMTKCELFTVSFYYDWVVLCFFKYELLRLTLKTLYKWGSVFDIIMG